MKKRMDRYQTKEARKRETYANSPFTSSIKYVPVLIKVFCGEKVGNKISEIEKLESCQSIFHLKANTAIKL